MVIAVSLHLEFEYSGRHSGNGECDQCDDYDHSARTPVGWERAYQNALSVAVGLSLGAYYAAPNRLQHPDHQQHAIVSTWQFLFDEHGREVNYSLNVLVLEYGQKSTTPALSGSGGRRVDRSSGLHALLSPA